MKKIIILFLLVSMTIILESHSKQIPQLIQSSEKYSYGNSSEKSNPDWISDKKKAGNVEETIRLENRSVNKIKPEEKLIKGTFIQPYSIIHWNTSHFEKRFKEYKSLRFDHVIIQWTEFYENQTGIKSVYYPSALDNKRLEKDLLTNLLVYGQKYNIKIYIGLNMNNQWWDNLGWTAEEFDEWWSGEADEAITLVEDIWDKYGRFASEGHFESFGGWYIPFEIDNVTFYSIEKQNILCRGLSRITNHIKKKSNLPVMVSPFFYREAGVFYGPDEWTKMWDKLLKKVSIDVIALQDGVGRKNVLGFEEDHYRVQAVKSVGAWFRATRAAIDKSDRKVELWSDLETFTEVINKDRKSLKSASWGRILAQMKEESPYVHKFTSFSFQAYQDYDIDKKLFLEYKKYLKGLEKR